MLIRYRDTGPVAALRGVIGRLTPAGRAKLRGQERYDMMTHELERPHYWCFADRAWSGPFVSWEAAVRWMITLAHIWGDERLCDRLEATQPSEDGYTDYTSDGTRIMIRAGGKERPCT